MKTVVNWQLPIKTASEANKRSKIVIKKYRMKDGSELKIKKRKVEHWREANKRHQEQKEQVKRVYHLHNPQIKLPAHIILTRISPRVLDAKDNLPMSLKWVSDAIADCIFPGQAAGRADDSKELTWEFHQEKGKVREYAVRIEIQEIDNV